MRPTEVHAVLARRLPLADTNIIILKLIHGYVRLYALVPFITIDSFEPFPDAGKWENNRSTRIVRDLTSPKLSIISD